MNLDFERKFWKNNKNFVFGMDEVGRGPLAGPVVACAVCISKDAQIKDEILEIVKDSKKLTHKKREGVLEQIKEMDGVWYALAELNQNKIDQINILNATMSCFRGAICDLEKTINSKADVLLIDGNKTIADLDGYFQNAIVGGDNKVFSIALASIVAKEYRDNLMVKYAQKYPNYGFEVHKGYGTKKHIEAIKKFGLCELHRKTFCKNFI